MKKHKVSVVIITEKNALSPDEELSFQQALEVFADFNKYLIISKDNHYDFKYDRHLEVIKLPERHFESVNSYSKLLLSGAFYELFNDSEFILIYQLDCFAFHNNLEEFLSYDYVGAPWFETQNHTGNSIIRTLLFRKPLTALGLILKYYSKHKISAVGNGGFSLRRVDKFIEITKDRKIQGILKTWLKCPRPHEDIFYAFIVPRYIKDFKIADMATSVKFSFETFPEKCYELTDHRLPVGCHAWAKHDPEFWKKIIHN